MTQVYPSWILKQLLASINQNWTSSVIYNFKLDAARGMMGRRCETTCHSGLLCVILALPLQCFLRFGLHASHGVIATHIQSCLAPGRQSGQQGPGSSKPSARVAIDCQSMPYTSLWCDDMLRYQSITHEYQWISTNINEYQCLSMCICHALCIPKVECRFPAV